MTDPESLPLPSFVEWPIFPFVGELHVRDVRPRRAEDSPRDGEPGGSPCGACAAPDTDYLWVDDHWRVKPPLVPSGAPVQLFLETRDHVDMDELDPARAAEMGQVIVRLDRAIQAVGGIGRVHVNRWGDGASHFHLWFYGRPVGDTQMIGFCLPLWAMTLPPTPQDEWQRNLTVVAEELAKGGGRAMV
ncbi:MAG: hypothetical protein WDA60_12540 [Acidimicrobiia bacterium]|jgi:hypothetical protein